MGAFGPRCCLQSCIWDELLSLPGLAEAPSKQLQGCLEGEVHTQNDRRQEPFEDKPKASLADAKFTKADSRAIADWYESYGYGPDMIAEAAAYAGEKKSVKYVNGILRAWYTKGYKTVRDVMAESAMGSSNVQAAAPAVKHNILGGGLRRAPRVPGMPQEGKTQ